MPATYSLQYVQYSTIYNMVTEYKLVHKLTQVTLLTDLTEKSEVLIF